MTKHPHRDTFLSKHHLLPKVRKLKGYARPYNILMLWRDKHTVWHIIFQNYTLREILNNWYKFDKYFETHLWKFLFHNLSPNESKNVLKRIARIKRNHKKRKFTQALPL